MAEERRPAGRHTLTIEDRGRLSASGVKKVDQFSPELIAAQTELGQLHIKGEGLHIEVLSSETGELRVTGRVTALSYSEGAQAAGFWGRLFQ